VDCPGFVRKVDACLDGRLGPEEARDLRKHAESCPRCAKLLAERQASDRKLRAWTAPEHVDWEAFESRVMQGIEDRRRTPFLLPLRQWGLAAAAAVVVVCVSAYLIWRAMPAQPVPVAQGTAPAEGEDTDSAELRRLSAPEEADARTLYYRGLEMLRNDEPGRAAQLFSEVVERYPGSGLAESSAYYHASIADTGMDASTTDESVLRERLAVWEGLRVDALAAEEMERTLYMRAMLSFHLHERSRQQSDRQRAAGHAAAYLSRFPGRSAEVGEWLRRVR